MATGAQVGRDLADPDGLRWRLARLEDDNAALRAERERLQEANERLRGEVEALRRAAKRQAAPFSKDVPTPNPKRPGRKPGAAYGTRAHRRPPEHVDQVVTVGLPACCPGCGGELVLERVAAQHVEDLPPTRPLAIRYQVHVGRCRSCGRRVQPRHPEQTSDALGAAGAQLGPRAVAPGSWLTRGWGCRLAGSPGCLATSAWTSPRVG